MYFIIAVISFFKESHDVSCNFELLRLKTFFRNLLGHFFFFLVSLQIELVDKSDILAVLLIWYDVCNWPVEWALRIPMPSLSSTLLRLSRIVDGFNFVRSFFLGFSLSSGGIMLILGISVGGVGKLFKLYWGASDTWRCTVDAL